MLGDRAAPAKRTYRKWEPEDKKKVVQEAHRLLKKEPKLRFRLGTLLRTAQLVLDEHLQRKINGPNTDNYKWFRDGIEEPPAPSEPEPKPAYSETAPPEPPNSPVEPEASESPKLFEGKSLWGQPLVPPPSLEPQEPIGSLKAEAPVTPPRPVQVPASLAHPDIAHSHRTELQELSRQVGKVNDWAEGMAREVARKLGALDMGLKILQENAKPAEVFDHTLFIEIAKVMSSAMQEQQSYMVRLGDTLVRAVNELKAEAKRQAALTDRTLGMTANMAHSLNHIDRKLSYITQASLHESRFVQPAVAQPEEPKKKEKPRILVVGVDSGHWKNHIKETAAAPCRVLEFQLASGEPKPTFGKDFDRVIITKKVPTFWVAKAKTTEGLKEKLVVVEGAADSIARGVIRTAEEWTNGAKKG